MSQNESCSDVTKAMNDLTSNVYVLEQPIPITNMHNKLLEIKHSIKIQINFADNNK